jgi:serine/threonine protein kinase
MITELFNKDENLEIIYRSREKQKLFWNEDALLKIAYNLIDTFAYLEHILICHRDIKPTNLFLLENYQIKVIDFGESVINYDDEDEEDNQVATVRGTPQYLSPKLWEAHVIRKVKEVEHNMFKSDVFSTGLVLFQLSAMKDVGGFNQKTEQNDGEELIRKGLKDLSKRYSEKLIEIIRKMLIFEEEKRPNFQQMGKFIAGEDYVPRVDKTIMEQKEEYNKKKIREIKLKEKIKVYEDKIEKQEKSEKINKFRNYVNENKMYINLKDSHYWFEYGGKSIGEFKINKVSKEIKNNNEYNKWAIYRRKNDFNFPYHYILAYVDEKYGYYLLGGCDADNCYQFKDGVITKKSSMSIQRLCLLFQTIILFLR